MNIILIELVDIINGEDVFDEATAWGFVSGWKLVSFSHKS